MVRHMGKMRVLMLTNEQGLPVQRTPLVRRVRHLGVTTVSVASPINSLS